MPKERTNPIISSQFKLGSNILHIDTVRMILWMVWKERNNRAFNDCVRNIKRIRDRWLHNFGTLILGHDVHGMDIISGGFSMY